MLSADCYSVVMLMSTVVFVLFTLVAFRRNAIHFLPLRLDRRWKFLHTRQKRRHLPDVLVAEGFVPSGHSGVADASTNGVIKVPLGIIEWFEDNLRRRRIHGMFQQTGFVIQRSMANGAIHAVDLHALDQTLVGGRNRIGYARR